jgi:hypothetical protein
VLLVLPSPLRPLVLLDNGNFATSDLNDHYRRVINRNNRLAKLIELKAPPVILKNEQRMLQLTVDALFANSLLPRKQQVLGDNNRPLKSLVDICLSKLDGSNFKRVDWSAQARAAIDHEIPSDRAAVPQSFFEGLRLASDVPVLLTLAEGDAFVALYPEPSEEGLILIPPAAARTISLPTNQDAFLSLHAPLRTDAVEEARRLARGEVRGRNVSASQSWVNPGPNATHEEILTQLAKAALSHEPAALNAPHAALLGGLGGAEFEEGE